MSETNRQSIISASDTAIGFDYQFYYFFYLILGLKQGDKIGLEEKDDIHVDLADGRLILIQTKHTLQTRSDGESINLSERDKDLWKTISNWTKIICEQTDRIGYVKNTQFQLISNKSISNNPFITKLMMIRNKEIKIKEFKLYLKTLYDSTSDTTIRNYINDLIILESKLLNDFCNQICFEFSQDDLIGRIKQRLLAKFYIEERIEHVYQSLHSELRDSNYLTIKSGTKKIISFEDFISKFRKCVVGATSLKLPFRDFAFSIPENPEKQLFIKQLIDIKDISINDRDEIIEFTTQMLQLYNNLKAWEESGDLLPSERKKFDKETNLIWKNSFRTRFREITEKIGSGESTSTLEEDIKKTAVSCLDEMRKQILKVDDTILSTELSNGQFYFLTENKQIGWHYDWKSKY
jgi:hypothetical protein